MKVMPVLDDRSVCLRGDSMENIIESNSAERVSMRGDPNDTCY